MEKKQTYILPDLKDRFYSFELKAGEVFAWNDYNQVNHLVFLLTGETEVIYGSLYPRRVSGGNMLFLTPMSNCVCKALAPVKMIIVGMDRITHSCDKFFFQNLSPIYSLIKYEFRELEIRIPMDSFLDLIYCYLKENISVNDLFPSKIRELFILFRAYYSSEEVAMLFYPLLGKNMEFRKMVADNYLRVKNAKEYADLCGYSLGVFQRKFKDVFGETVYQWMQRQKAEQIKHMLMTTDISLKELAEKLDFASPAHLNKFCKIWFEMTPTEVRQTFILKKKLR